MMDIRKLQRTIVDALEDIKALDIKVFNTTELSDLFDRVVIATGSSNRQTRSLASSVAEKVKAAGGTIISTEGADSGDWVLVDCGDAVVHVMQPAVRAYYNLEEIWGLKPVNLRSVEPKSVASRSAASKSATPKSSVPKSAAPKSGAPKSVPLKSTAAKSIVKSGKTPRARRAGPARRA